MRWLQLPLLLLVLFSHSIAATDGARSLPAQEPITPIPLRQELDAGKVALGRALFHDLRLSRDNTVSCASCHQLAAGGDDGRTLPVGIGAAIGVVNTPTVLNSGLNFVQFWDGRALTLEEQIDGPINNPNELGSDWPTVLSRLRSDEGYRELFSALYPEGITRVTVRESIATFERSLLTPNSRFDRYLRGDLDAITQQELQGYQHFKGYGCISCHQGVAVGGNMYERMGIVHDYFAERGTITEADYGRFNVTGLEEDRFEFKVPGLRNVALTAPYFHDGSASTLEEAVRTMARYQLGRPLPEDDIGAIVAFLRTLTGELPGGTDGVQ